MVASGKRRSAAHNRDSMSHLSTHRGSPCSRLSATMPDHGPAGNGDGRSRIGGVGVRVAVGGRVGVGVRVGVGEGVGVGDRVGVGRGVTVGRGVRVAGTIVTGVRVGVAVGAAVGVGGGPKGAQAATAPREKQSKRETRLYLGRRCIFAGMKARRMR